MTTDDHDPGGLHEREEGSIPPVQENVSTKSDGSSRVVMSEEILGKIFSRLTEINHANIVAMKSLQCDVDHIFEKLSKLNTDITYLCDREDTRQSQTSRNKRRTLPSKETPQVTVTNDDTPLTPTMTEKTFAEVTANVQRLNQANKQRFPSKDNRDRGLNFTDIRHNNDMERIFGRPRSNTQSSQTIKIKEKKKADPVEALMDKAARTVGLRPISESRIIMHANREREKNRDRNEDTIMEEAKRSIVIDFFKNELSMKEDALDQIEIEQIFKSKNGKMKDTLYVRMKEKKSTAIVYGHAKNISRNTEAKVSLEKYIPHQAFERYQAVETLAYNARIDENQRTDVRIGKRDFLFRKKSKDDPTPWGQIDYVDLPVDLPRIDPTAFSNPTWEPSTPNGREPVPDAQPLVTTLALTNEEESESEHEDDMDDNDDVDGLTDEGTIKIVTPANSARRGSIVSKNLGGKSSQVPASTKNTRSTSSSASAKQKSANKG